MDIAERNAITSGLSLSGIGPMGTGGGVSVATSGRVPVPDPVCALSCGGRAERVAVDAGDIEEEDIGGGTMRWPDGPF